MRRGYVWTECHPLLQQRPRGFHLLPAHKEIPAQRQNLGWRERPYREIFFGRCLSRQHHACPPVRLLEIPLDGLLESRQIPERLAPRSNAVASKIPAQQKLPQQLFAPSF